MTSSPDVTIAIVEKGANAQVRVTLSKWRGRTKVHVREYNPGAIAGQWWPGKGACLPVEKLPELVKALQDAEADARHRGLLSDAKNEVTV
jgi:hypothetical protein